jgi:4-alpha-glucanotransferase
MATKLRPARSSGVLLHPTSLPGRFGIGDLGPAAHAWVDALAAAKQTWWQILPLGPTGYGDSPYQCFSAFAGNPYLVSPDLLAHDGLVRQDDVANVHFPADRVDYGPVIDFKLQLLGRAWETFAAGKAPALRAPFEEFCARERHWLDDYALFMAIKHAHGNVSWQEWPAELRRREPGPIDRARRSLADAARSECFRQFLVFRQWEGVKRHAHRKGVRLIGDVPIFVSVDSADVWANPQLFLLDADRRPTTVAGVPPDYFSPTGQLWGNPQYDWDAMRRDGYRWWVDRLRATLHTVDVVRLDHFRGFCAAWHVPADAETAVVGEWVDGPRGDLFDVLRRALGGLPLIAEDLGEITPDVDALREELDLPGMRILQFAFGGKTEDRFLPHNYDPHTVVYTGTHDNDTTRGWYKTITEAERDFIRRYLGRSGDDVSWDLIRLALSSVADYAVVPLQDMLDLGTEARMNRPAIASGNWAWRFRREQITDFLLARLADLTTMYSRQPLTPETAEKQTAAGR